ncbi:MAG: 50S ribosomal protein L4 [Opitutales bacterium]
MKLKVYTRDGSSSQEKDFEQFPQLEDSKGRQALKDLIVAYQANARQGTAKAKTRAEVAGTGKKPYRQKGTGNARRGSNQSPIISGGGVVFGPHPRDYSKHVNKKVRKLAFRRALVDKAAEGGLDLIEAFSVDQPKTKLFVSVLNRIRPEGKVLIVDEQFDDSMVLAARNVERVQMTEADTVNAMDLTRYACVLVSERGFEKILARASA